MSLVHKSDRRQIQMIAIDSMISSDVDPGQMNVLQSNSCFPLLMNTGVWPTIETVITKIKKIQSYLKNRHQENF